jgi:RimJ/RimL family protein N-acetyltransferase
MDGSLLTGKLTRLVAAGPDEAGELFATWSRDSEFMQLWDTDAPMVRNAKKAQEWLRKEFEKQDAGNFGFVIQRLENTKNVGMVGLWNALTPHHNAMVSIGIGERELWGKGYGTDAMNIALRFAFQELNLHRVTLHTFAINPRAIRSYEKSGFVREGNMRGAMKRFGERADHVHMGILREEWEAKQNG